MNGLYLLVLFFLMIDAQASEEKLLFSVEKRTEYNFLQTKSIFTMLESGKYQFETSTGGFELCSGAPVGKFSGKLSKEKTKELKELFLNLKSECKKLKTCQTKVNAENRNQFTWSVSGWGDFSDRSYHFSGLTKAPKFFSYLFSIEKDLYQNRQRSLTLTKKQNTKEMIKLELRYDSAEDKKQTVVKNPQAFIVLRGNTSRRLQANSDVKMEVVEYEGHGHLTHNLNKKENQLQPGDQLIYLPSKDEGLNPCIEIAD